MKRKVQSLKCKIVVCSRYARTINYFSNAVRKLLSFSLLAFSFKLLITPAYAQSPIPIGEKFGFGDIRSLGEGTSRLVVPVFEVTAAIVVIYFLVGAFFYLKAGGDKEQLEKARNMINHAIIGFIILMFAFLIIQFLLSSLFDIQLGII